MDATALAAAIASGGTSATAALEASLDAAGTRAALGAVRRVEPGPARRRAAAVDAAPAGTGPRGELSRGARTGGALAGVPTLAKDLGGPFEGLAVRAGSAALPDGPAAPPSDLARRFGVAGLNAFGLTTVPEFGLSLATEPAIGPLARNPLAPHLTPGGSSGGAAAAVAAGVVAVAHATDAGGSIRVPAACCGLVGLKPSRGAMPQGPDFSNLLGGLASEFALCRTVRDAALAWGSLAGGGGGPYPAPAPIPVERADGTLRVGLALPDEGVDGARREALESAARALDPDPVIVRHARVGPLADDAWRVFDALACANLAHLVDAFDLDEAAMEPLSAAVAARGRRLDAVRLCAAIELGARVAHAAAALFDVVDVLVLPMLGGPPAPLGALPTDHDDVARHWARLRAIAPNAALANVAGCPALSLPFGTDADGLPLPVQLLAPVGGDARLLVAAARLERERPWTHRFAVAGSVDA